MATGTLKVTVSDSHFGPAPNSHLTLPDPSAKSAFSRMRQRLIPYYFSKLRTGNGFAEMAKTPLRSLAIGMRNDSAWNEAFGMRYHLDKTGGQVLKSVDCSEPNGR